MDDTQTVAMVAALAAALLQAVKDWLKWPPQVVGPVVGALAAAVVTALNGEHSAQDYLTNIGIGAGLIVGTHNLLLQKKFLGNVLKGIMQGMLKPTANP